MNDDKTIINIFLKLKIYQRVFLIILILNHFFGYWFFNNLLWDVINDAEFWHRGVLIISSIFLLPLLNQLPKASKSVYQLLIVIFLVIIASLIVMVSGELESMEDRLRRIHSELRDIEINTSY